MRRRVLALAGLTVSANSYAPAARSSSLKSQVQHAHSDAERVPVSRRGVSLQLESASAESLESSLQCIAGTEIESQEGASIQSDGLLAGNNQTTPGSQNVSASLHFDRLRTRHETPNRIQALASRRFREALPKLGGDELDRVVLSTAIPSVSSSSFGLTSVLRMHRRFVETVLTQFRCLQLSQDDQPCRGTSCEFCRYILCWSSR
jgi:hypothetical protein